jgi:hypothetical protein
MGSNDASTLTTRRWTESIRSTSGLGDFIADRSEFALEPNFGAGKYRVYFGLYNGNRRLEVRRGPAEENRLDAGFLDVL